MKDSGVVGEDVEKGRLAVQWFLVDQTGSKHPAAQGTLKRSAAGNTSYQYRPIGVGLTYDFPDKVCAVPRHPTIAPAAPNHCAPVLP